MTLKLSQLYEAVISEVLRRTNVLLSNAGAPYDGDNDDQYDGDNRVIYEGDNGVELGCAEDQDLVDVSDDDYDGDKPLSARSNDADNGDNCTIKNDHYDGDNSYYWEDEFEDVMRWMEVRELDLANQIPSYKSMAELSAYVSKLQHIRSDIVSNDEKVANTLEAFYDTLQKSPRVVADTARKSPTQNSDTTAQNDGVGGIFSKVLPLELRWSKLQWESEGTIFLMRTISKN